MSLRIQSFNFPNAFPLYTKDYTIGCKGKVMQKSNPQYHKNTLKVLDAIDDEIVGKAKINLSDTKDKEVKSDRKVIVSDDEQDEPEGTTARKDTSAGGETNIYGSSSRTNSEPTDKSLATTPEPAALSEKETEILTNIEPLATASTSPIAKEKKKASTSIASTLIKKTSRSVRAKKKVTKKANTTTTEEPLVESEFDATIGQVVGELEVPKKRPRTKHPNVEEASEPAL
ncbi:hypothetical protein COLO4_27428 [Corchorus olitorius]|uniref:Uncharacterized protein n=1 Tax=Corchorus olitorius TaxID=93759 RepID=A0A1R3HR51_9ROSI|nr:hypothetical protein COLO4_27428 [Corchorus olitorius]